MRITRVFLNTSLKIGVEIKLDNTTHHYIINVLRLKSGSNLVVFDGRGGEYEATLTRVTRTTSGITINKFIDCNRESILNTRLLQGICRSDRMDYALQKAVELGVSEIQPITSQLCSTRMNTSRLRNKYRHWKQVIVAACEQSGRTRMPKIFHPLTLKDSVKYGADSLGIVLNPQEGCNLTALKLPVQKTVSILVGPEGGFTQAELAMILQGGFTLVRMGPRTLRTETAGVAALVALQILWGDLINMDV